MTLELDEVKDILDKFQIRPGGLWEYTVQLDDDDPAKPVLELVTYTQNSRDERYFEEFPPDELPVTLTMRRPLTPEDISGEGTLVEVVVETVASFAAHEALEWIRYKGEIPYDPHVSGEPKVVLWG